MTFVAEILASFTPQVLFGMFGGLVGGIYGINKKGYELKISSILLFTAIVAGSAVAEFLDKKFGLDYIFPIFLISIPAGSFSGYLMVALDIASPKLAKAAIDKASKKAIDKL